MPKKRILVIGDRRVGKSSFIRTARDLYKLNLIEFTGSFPFDIDGIIMLFDMNNFRSYLNIDKWNKLLEINYNLREIPVVIYGNKYDIAPYKFQNFNEKICSFYFNDIVTVLGNFV